MSVDRAVNGKGCNMRFTERTDVGEAVMIFCADDRATGVLTGTLLSSEPRLRPSDRVALVMPDDGDGEHEVGSVG